MPAYNNYYRGVYNASMGLLTPPETPQEIQNRKNKNAKQVAKNLVEKYKLKSSKPSSRRRKGGALYRRNTRKNRR